jgi:hypothetical protein
MIKKTMKMVKVGTEDCEVKTVTEIRFLGILISKKEWYMPKKSLEIDLKWML